jgi:hypothetical protein
MKFEKSLNICVEYKHTKRVPVDDNMLRQIALSLYEIFHKEDGTEEKQTLLQQVEDGCISLGTGLISRTLKS